MGAIVVQNIKCTGPEVSDGLAKHGIAPVQRRPVVVIDAPETWLRQEGLQN